MGAPQVGRQAEAAVAAPRQTHVVVPVSDPWVLAVVATPDHVRVTMTVRFSSQLVPELIQPFWAPWQAGEFLTDAAAKAGTHRQRRTGTCQRTAILTCHARLLLLRERANVDDRAHRDYRRPACRDLGAAGPAQRRPAGRAQRPLPVARALRCRHRGVRDPAGAGHDALRDRRARRGTQLRGQHPLRRPDIAVPAHPGRAADRHPRHPPTRDPRARRGRRRPGTGPPDQRRLPDHHGRAGRGRTCQVRATPSAKALAA